MNARMEEYTLMKAAVTQNAMKEEISTWTDAGTIRAALSLASGSQATVNEFLRIESTHTAVTYDEADIGDRIRGADGTVYHAQYVTPGAGRRGNTLHLKVIK